MDRDIAQKISALMLEYGAKLDESLAVVQRECTDEEFDSYRVAVSRLMAIMLREVMNPLYLEHPDIKPKQLK
ncbi:MAG: hypothetical protein AAGF57_08425 [Pseudomonadota bacterium]